MPDPLTTAVATAWLWDKYGEKIINKAAGELQKRWQAFRWDEAARKYRQRVADIYGHIQIMGMTEPVLLKDVYTDVYVLDKPSTFIKHSLAELRQMPSWEKITDPRPADRHRGLNLAKSGKDLFILGGPGAGKTTFVKHLALEAVQGRLNKIPLVVELRDWTATDLALMPYLVRQFEICAFPEAQPFIEQVLSEGQALVLFDGLDEVSEAGNQRRDVIRVIKEFQRQYHRSQCLVTCRIAATDYTFEGFTYLQMADFTPRQIESFVTNWFAKDKFRREKFLADFNKAENEGVRELARSPLLLTLLCLAFAETLHIPQRRVEIYEEALEALLKKWDTSRNIVRAGLYQQLSLGHKRQLFAWIAAQTLEAGHLVFGRKELAERIEAFLKRLPNQPAAPDGGAVLTAIEAQHGLFVERAQGIYSFSHKTFHEYFTAKYIAGLTSERQLRDVLRRHLADGNWREVFLLTASLLDEADVFFEVMLGVIEEIVADEPVLGDLLQWAARRAAETDAPYQPSAVSNIYLYLALASSPDYDLYLTLDHDTPVDSDFNRLAALHLASIRLLYLDRASAGATIIAMAFTLGRTSALGRASALASDLYRDLNREFNCDNIFLLDWELVEHCLNYVELVKLILMLDCPFENNTNFKHYFNRLIAASGQLGLSQLQATLADLSLPVTGTTLEEWSKFEVDFREVIIRERNLGHDWQLSREQFKVIARYLAANNLLVDCLNLATVSNREAILNRILLPPAQRGEA